MAPAKAELATIKALRLILPISISSY